MLTLLSKENTEFQLKQEVAQASGTIKDLMEDAGIEDPIPLPNVDEKTLREVVSFMSTMMSKSEEEINKYYTKFDQETLFSMILAANYLDIKVLLDGLCKTVADMIKGKTPEEIRKTFNIKNDFTPEEEEQVRKENEWCEER